MNAHVGLVGTRQRMGPCLVWLQAALEEGSPGAVTYTTRKAESLNASGADSKTLQRPAVEVIRKSVNYLFFAF